MKAKVIKTEADYDAAMARIDELLDAKPGTPQADELEVLSILVELFEKKTFPIDLPDPISAIRFRMEQQGLEAKDLVPYLGSPSKVSEVLAGHRNLSLSMIRKPRLTSKRNIEVPASSRNAESCSISAKTNIG